MTLGAQPHEIMSCRNDGWDADPSWHIVCACEWEAWNQPTEAAVRELHSEHHAELLLTGRCCCLTCQAGLR